MTSVIGKEKPGKLNISRKPFLFFEVPELKMLMLSG